MSGLNVTVKTTSSETILEFVGELNEFSNDLDKIQVNPSLDLHLNMAGLKGINSVGITQFHKWIHGLQCKNLHLVQASKSFVTQLNMVRGFMPEKTIIESFFVPYYSEEASEEKSVLLTRNKDFQKIGSKVNLKIPVVKDSAGNDMELDVFKEKYFRFLESYC